LINKTYNAEILNLSKYYFVGAFSYFYITGLTFYFHEYIHLSETYSFALSVISALFINFIFLKRFVFKSKKKISTSSSRYLLLSLISRVFEILIFSVLLNFGIYYLFASTSTMIVSSLSKYFIMKKYVF
jgi:putative flippase GtrA